MFNGIKVVLPNKLEPETEYFLSDGRTAVVVITDETAKKFTIQQSRVLGIITNDKQITFDVAYLDQLQFFTGSTSFYEKEPHQ